MYVGRDFSDMDSDEDEVFAFDFTYELAAGEVPASTSWSILVIEGKDPNAQSRLNGSAQLNGNMSLQRVTDPVPGVRYRLKADIVTNQSNTKSLWSFFNCTTPG